MDQNVNGKRQTLKVYFKVGNLMGVFVQNSKILKIIEEVNDLDTSDVIQDTLKNDGKTLDLEKDILNVAYNVKVPV